MVGKTKDGVYYFFVRYKTIDGKIKQKRVQSREWKTKKEAQLAERSFLNNVSEPSESLTVDQLYEIYKREHGPMMKAKSLYTQNNTYTNHIKSHLGSVLVSKIDNRTISQWQQMLLKKGFSNRYLGKIQEYLRTILIYGEKHDLITKNPFKLDILQRKNEPKPDMQFWTIDEFTKFISEVDDPVYETFFRVLYWCGLREGEAAALTLADIDLENSTIRVNKTVDFVHKVITTPKTQNSNRTVAMTTGVKEATRRQIEAIRQVFGYTPTDDAKTNLFAYDLFLAPTSIKRKQVEACKRAGVKVIRIHDFRHSHVSLLVNMGFNPFEIAKRLGHTVEMVNNVYSHWFMESQLNMVKKLDEQEAIATRRPMN